MDWEHHHWRKAEICNGRLAMFGLVCATINYFIFGTMFPF